MALIDTNHDPMGQAIRDYFEHGKALKLWVCSEMFEDDEMPVPHLFRTAMQMNAMERRALSLCRGRVLDVGAGAGCHALILQEKRDISVSAIDVSPLSVETMRRRGVLDCQLVDFFDESFVGCFDVVLMLMNGIGIVGRIAELPRFFKRLDSLLAPGGFLLTDSTDLRYVFEDEEGNFDVNEFEHYYGEVDYTMHYGKVHGESFPWLYVDFDTLCAVAEEAGFCVTMVQQGEHYDYLAKIERKTSNK